MSLEPDRFLSRPSPSSMEPLQLPPSRSSHSWHSQEMPVYVPDAPPQQSLLTEAVAGRAPFVGVMPGTFVAFGIAPLVAMPLVSI